MTFTKSDTPQPNTPPELQKVLRDALESKPDKFIRLATARTLKAIFYIEKIGNLSSRKGTYTPEQVDKIILAIDTALNKCEQKLLGTEPKPQPFKL